MPQDYSAEFYYENNTLLFAFVYKGQEEYRFYMSPNDETKCIRYIGSDGNTQDFTQDVNLTIIDKNQEALSDSEMNSLRIENNAKVVVTARLWKIRQGVGISASYVGTPADGYEVGSVKTVPDTISVAGSTEGLESLAENNNVITIPAFQENRKMWRRRSVLTIFFRIM